MDNKKYLGVILAIFILHIVVNCYVFLDGKIVRTSDEATTLRNGLKYYNLIFLSDKKVVDKMGLAISLNTLQTTHPPLVYFCQSLVWKITHIFNRQNENLVILITNAAFLLILLLSLFGISIFLRIRNVYLPAVLISFIPAVFFFSRTALLDFPLMCIISVWLLFLLKTRNLSSWLDCAILGIIMAMGQLIKETFFIFVLPALIYYVYRSYIINKTNNFLRNLLILITVFVFICCIIYLNPSNFFIYRIYFGKFLIKNTHSSFFYIKSLVYLAGPIFFIVTLPLLIRGFFLGYPMRLLILSLFMPILLFSFSANEESRYLVPALPFYILAISIQLDKLAIKRVWNKIYAIFVILCLFVQFAVLSVPLFMSMPFSNLINLQYRFSEFALIKDKRSGYSRYYSAHLKLLDVLRKEALFIKDGENKRILFLFYFDGQIHDPLSYRVLMYKLPFTIICPMEKDSADLLLSKNANWQDKVFKADYVIDKTGDLGNIGHNPGIADELREGFNKYRNYFVKIAEITMFDGYQICVYKKIIKIT